MPMPMFGLIASAGEPSATSRPSTRIWPARGGVMPKQALNRSCWPMPAGRPRPGSRLAAARSPRRARPASSPRASSTSGRVSVGGSARGGNACDRLRPIMRSITSSSLNASAGPVDMCLPLRRMVRRSQNSRTSRMRCEMNTTVTPWRLRRSMMPPSQSTSRPASVDVGSSSSRMRGWRHSARAISTFWRCASSSAPASARRSTSNARPRRCASTRARRAIMPSGPCGA